MYSLLWFLFYSIWTTPFNYVLIYFMGSNPIWGSDFFRVSPCIWYRCIYFIILIFLNLVLSLWSHIILYRAVHWCSYCILKVLETFNSANVVPRLISLTSGYKVIIRLATQWTLHYKYSTRLRLIMSSFWLLVTSAKEVLAGFVCLFVSNITQTLMDRFWWNF